MSGLKHFLIVHDAVRGSMREDVRTFDDVAEALAALRDAEHRFEGERIVHVVLLSSDSLETVKRTHSIYWGGDDRARSILVRQAARG
jgi:hypothetical protein